MELNMDSWERQPGEPPKAWAAFCVYRDLGPARSLVKSFNKQRGEPDGKKQPYRGYFKWSADYEWNQRAQNYDAYIELTLRRSREEEGRKQHEKEITDYQERQRKLSAAAVTVSVGLLNLIGEKLKTLKAADIPLGSLPAYIRAAAAVAEAASNSEAQAIGAEDILKVLNGGKSDSALLS